MKDEDTSLEGTSRTKSDGC